MCLEIAKYRGTLGRNGGGWRGVQAVFVAKIKKVPGNFLQCVGGWWGVCPENSPFSESTPKEDGVFSKSTPPHQSIQTKPSS